MGKKAKIKFVFANNLPKNTAEEPVEETPVLEEPQVEETPDTDEVVDEKKEVEVSNPVGNSDDSTKINYPPLTYPVGTPENGILLCIILSLITLFSLGFLIWHEHTWRQQEELNTDVQVDTVYDELTSLVRAYIRAANDPRKAEYCAKLKEVYLAAAKSPEDIASVEETVRDKSREILEFNKPKREMTTEYVWQTLLGSTGIINTWLLDKNIVVTKDNQKDIFTAIAKGFE